MTHEELRSKSLRDCSIGFWSWRVLGDLAWRDVCDALNERELLTKLMKAEREWLANRKKK